jgi:hypothetical protein
LTPVVTARTKPRYDHEQKQKQERERKEQEERERQRREEEEKVTYINEAEIVRCKVSKRDSDEEDPICERDEEPEKEDELPSSLLSNDCREVQKRCRTADPEILERPRLDLFAELFHEEPHCKVANPFSTPTPTVPMQTNERLADLLVSDIYDEDKEDNVDQVC